MTTSEYRIKIVTPDEARQWRAPLWGEGLYQAVKDAIEASGEVLFYFWTEREAWGDKYDDTRHFTWYCPGCGGSNGGTLADVPVGGWDNPRWGIQNEDPDHLTLTPSLGCPLWRAEKCIGHWWARDGKLVLA